MCRSRPRHGALFARPGVRQPRPRSRPDRRTDRRRRVPVAARRAAHLCRSPGVAVCGGFFVVPLYAIIQRRSEEASRARIDRRENVVNALFMTGAAARHCGAAAAGLDTPTFSSILGDPNAGVTLWICRLLPQDVLRMLARIVFRLAYRVEVRGARESRGGRRARHHRPQSRLLSRRAADRRFSAGLCRCSRSITAQMPRMVGAAVSRRGRYLSDGPDRGRWRRSR